MFMAMIKLFLILLVGYCCHKWKVLPESAQSVLTKLVIYVSTPCSVVHSVFTAEVLPSLQTVLLLLGLSFACYGVLFLVSVPLVKLLRIQPGKQGIYINMLMFSNCLFIGLPVVQAVFGEEALFYLAIFSIPFNPCLYVLGVYLLIRDGHVRGNQDGQAPAFRLSMVFSPVLIASGIAIALAVTRLSLPDVIVDTLSLFNGITTPGAMLVIGISIAKMPLKEVFNSPKIYAMSAARLILFPVLIWFLLRMVLQDPLALGVGVVTTAMPVAASIPMLASEYGSDTQSAVQGVCITTLLSMITIPLLVSILL